MLNGNVKDNATTVGFCIRIVKTTDCAIPLFAIIANVKILPNFWSKIDNYPVSSNRFVHGAMIFVPIATSFD